jgi:hypothetical protein
MSTQFQAGDYVVYQKSKFSVHPGPHAKGISPAPNGDSYSYNVDKFWRVVAVQPDGKFVVCTRRGKQHTLAADDPALRRAYWWERYLLRRRFPTLPPHGLDIPSTGNPQGPVRPNL